MIVFLNGRFVEEEQAVVSVFDRAFLYGDGLFETLLIFNAKPFGWEEHLARLKQGAAFLKLSMPLSGGALLEAARELINKNDMTTALLRITVSRGVGLRGYSPRGADQPLVVMSLHPVAIADADEPSPCRLITSTFCLPANEPLARFKTCNKLPQIMARAQADAAGAEEALLLNTEEFVVGAASSNLFWIDNDTVCTAPLNSGILPGITRAVVFKLCKGLGLPWLEASVRPEELRLSVGVFLSLSSVGIVEAVSLDGKRLAKSSLVKRLHTAYWKLVHSECA